MKMKHIILITILFSGLMYLISCAKIKQLFEVVNKELTANVYNKNIQNGSGAIDSIFTTTKDEKNSSTKEIYFAQESGTKSLFDEEDYKPVTQSLFGDNNESDDLRSFKFINKEKNNIKINQNANSLLNNDKSTKSLFGGINKNNNNSNNQNKDKTNNKIETNSLFDIDYELIEPQIKLNQSIKPNIKLPERKSALIQNINNNNNIKRTQINNNSHLINSKTVKNIKRKPVTHNIITQKPIVEKILQESKSEIDKLKSKVLNLITINKQFMKELEKKRKIKKKTLEVSNNLINLIETHQIPIIEYQQNFKNTQIEAAEESKKKETELHQAYGEVRKNLDVLVEKIDYTKNVLKEVRSNENLMSGELKNNYNTDSLSVLNNVQVEGLTSVHNLNAESVDVGHIKFDLEKIMITNPQTEIIVGSEILSLRELVENFEVLEKLKERCRENFENCVQFNEEHFENDMRKQNEIIEELKVLRKQTNDIRRKD
jgi:hypothetical protein